MTNQSTNDDSNKESKNGKSESGSIAGSIKRLFRKNNKLTSILILLDFKNFNSETLNMNSQLFQTIEESKDVTQYVKTVEALVCHVFKTYTVDLSSLF